MGSEADGLAERLLRREVVAEPVALVVAHPDDETIGAGAVLPRLSDLLLVHATDGAPPDGADARAAGFATPAEYAAARERELAAALAAAGVSPARLSLGLPDQGAARALAWLARRLAAALSRHGVRAVLTHPCEGGHPDHDSVAFAVHAAVALLEREGAAPAVLEMAFYHAGPRGWTAGEFLPGGAPSTTLALTPAERARKAAMLACFGSQAATLAQFPLEAERFRPSSPPDLTAPPHPGPLLYERFPWGVDGATWRGLAAAALAELGLPGGLAGGLAG